MGTSISEMNYKKLCNYISNSIQILKILVTKIRFKIFAYIIYNQNVLSCSRYEFCVLSSSKSFPFGKKF